MVETPITPRMRMEWGLHHVVNACTQQAAGSRYTRGTRTRVPMGGKEKGERKRDERKRCDAVRFDAKVARSTWITCRAASSGRPLSSHAGCWASPGHGSGYSCQPPFTTSRLPLSVPCTPSRTRPCPESYLAAGSNNRTCRSAPPRQ